MNDIQFMGLRIRFDDRECMNNSWQSIHGATNKMVEDARKLQGNQFVVLRIRFDDGGCTNNSRKSIRGAPDSMVEDA